MKKIYGILVVSAVVLLLASCVDSGRVLPSATGTIYEALVVMDDRYWDAAEGDTVRAYLAADMACMPQMEPLFTLSQTGFNGFSDILKPVRNIFIADIDSAQYTQGRVYYYKNPWAKPQTVVKVAAPDRETFMGLMSRHGQSITEHFVNSELQRQVRFYEGYTNKKAKEAAMRKFGIAIAIPTDMAQMTEAEDFLWVTDNKSRVRRDVVVYSYPYTDKDTFTKEYLLAKRDSIMKRHVQGSYEGSYMGTEYRHIPPKFRAITVNGGYCAEVRGLWRMLNGDAMGGPFVSHTRLDEVNQRVITVESFVYGPGEKKRNAMRQAEAILYSVKLPQEINALPEVEVVSETVTE